MVHLDPYRSHQARLHAEVIAIQIHSYRGQTTIEKVAMAIDELSRWNRTIHSALLCPYPLGSVASITSTPPKSSGTVWCRPVTSPKVCSKRRFTACKRADNRVSETSAFRVSKRRRVHRKKENVIFPRVRG